MEKTSWGNEFWWSVLAASLVMDETVGQAVEDAFQQEAVIEEVSLEAPTSMGRRRGQNTDLWLKISPAGCLGRT
jgi:hypothetical protein